MFEGALVVIRNTPNRLLVITQPHSLLYAMSFAEDSSLASQSSSSSSSSASLCTGTIPSLEQLFRQLFQVLCEQVTPRIRVIQAGHPQDPASDVGLVVQLRLEDASQFVEALEDFLENLEVVSEDDLSDEEEKE